MKIAVIGTGNMGAGFARALAAANLDVVLGDRSPDKAAALAREIGARVQAGGMAAALKAADVVLLALPYGAIGEVVRQAAGDLEGKVLVDISNPFTADFKDLQVGHSTSAAETIQAVVPAARVVKAFNTIFAGLLPVQARQGKRLQVLVAGDDPAANARVRHLAEALSFEPVDAGPLRNSRFIEPLGMMNIQLGLFLGWGPGTAPAWVRV
jgi:NADPH-dependent F420 reductase